MFHPRHGRPLTGDKLHPLVVKHFVIKNKIKINKNKGKEQHVHKMCSVIKYFQLQFSEVEETAWK